MKRIGIVGGLGPESTLYYYRTLVDLCRENKDLRGNQPEIIIYSLNDNEMWQANQTEKTARVVAALESLYQAGADFGLIACNSAHRTFNDIETSSPIPLLSIVEETCDAVTRRGLKKVGLFGALTTMKSDFYQQIFSKRNISIAVPRDNEQAYIGDKVFSELVLGIMLDGTRNEFLKIAQRMVDRDLIQGLILGCTEIPLLLNKTNEAELEIPFFDTSKIHCQSALRYCLSDETTK